jgi:hypothetical protein
VNYTGHAKEGSVRLVFSGLTVAYFYRLVVNVGTCCGQVYPFIAKIDLQMDAVANF